MWRLIFSLLPFAGLVGCTCPGALGEHYEMEVQARCRLGALGLAHAQAKAQTHSLRYVHASHIPREWVCVCSSPAWKSPVRLCHTQSSSPSPTPTAGLLALKQFMSFIFSHCLLHHEPSMLLPSTPSHKVNQEPGTPCGHRITGA